MSREKVLITIAARGGSKGVKNKNIRSLNGLPLIAHTILQAKQWGRADRIICSTDSKEIAAVAKEYGAEVPFLRPKELATDKTGKLEVLKHALKTLEEREGEPYSIVVDLDVTAPIRRVDDIDGAFELFKKRKPKSVFSVTPSRRNPYFNMVEENEDGFMRLVKDSKVKRRQDTPKVYDMNASIYVYERDYLLDVNTNSAISDQSLVWIMDDLSAFDIDCEDDFYYIEYLVLNRKVKL